MWKNGSGRVTFQASAKNKFNAYWDEQSFCQDPCTGVVSVYTSPESWISVQTHPDRLQQLTWTNPLTNKILLEAGVSVQTQVLRHLPQPQLHQLRRHPAHQRTGCRVRGGRHGAEP